jgi:hypothetical protein
MEPVAISHGHRLHGPDFLVRAPDIHRIRIPVHRPEQMKALLAPAEPGSTAPTSFLLKYGHQTVLTRSVQVVWRTRSPRSSCFTAPHLFPPGIPAGVIVLTPYRNVYKR